ncbi:MAG: hypothetical protein K2N73_06335 [Lachnospiraceae bacterium]|nr:hypothetical protein [Lachnospiraceae bacterium]
MAGKVQGREAAFVETYDEAVKKTIEKTFLKHGISYLIKVDKVRDMKKGRFECRVKYAFYINRFQTDEAKAAITEEDLDENSVVYLL